MDPMSGCDMAVTSVLCLHYRPETVHCSTKDAYTSEITFLALLPWVPPAHIDSHRIETRVCLSKLGYNQENIDKHTQMERRLA